MRNLKKLTPFGRFCCTIGNLPTSYMESLTYEQQLIWLCKYLEEKVTPAILDIQKFLESLDLQDEVNKKLDEMAESGELEEIIAQYLRSAGLITFNTLSDLKTAENIIDGSTVKTLGRNTIGDLGGAIYKVRNVINTDVIDDMTIIQLNDETLVAEYVLNDFINPKQFGAIGDGEHDDLIAIQKAVDLGDVKMSKGTYYVSDSIVVDSNKIFDGNLSTFITSENKYVFKIEATDNTPKQMITIKNVLIDSSINESNGILVKNSYLITLENNRVLRLKGQNKIAFNIINGFNHTIRNCSAYGLKDPYYTGQIGLNIENEASQISGIENMTNEKFENLLLQNFDYAVKANFTAGNAVNFENTGISHCKYGFYFSGTCLPLSVKNSRIEWRRTDTSTGYGLYLTNDIQANIENLDVYNVPVGIHNESNKSLMLSGVVNCNGDAHNPQLSFVDTNNSLIVNSAIFTMVGTVYKIGDGWTNVTNTCDNTLESVISANTISAVPLFNSFYKITSSIIINMFGRKGQKMYLYTLNNNVTLYGTAAGSTTNKWVNSVTMLPGKVYTVTFINNNEAIIEG